MSRITVKTSEMIGAALDWAVAKACDALVAVELGGRLMDMSDPTQFGDRPTYSPSTDWSQGGPLLDKYMVRTQYAADTEKRADAGCLAQVWRPYAMANGDTLLIAACRAIVAANLGDEVQIPAELLP